MDVWEDFRCPICKELETSAGAAIQQFADDGTYKIHYHLATFLDDRLGGSGSMTALEAAGAALQEGPEKFKAFHDYLYAHQPDEKADGFGSRDKLLDLAENVPGLVTPAFTDAVNKRTYAPWAAKVSAQFASSGVSGTPTLKLDGKQLNVFSTTGTPVTADQYKALVQQAVGGAK
ncbi:DsbA family protein [Kitasatospora cineracea]|uniref:DsbA family protein n=1 Tax=Kitasatospora cineracea TaxID=88074 RepID=UPI0037A24974